MHYAFMPTNHIETLNFATHPTKTCLGKLHINVSHVAVTFLLVLSVSMWANLLENLYKSSCYIVEAYAQNFYEMKVCFALWILLLPASLRYTSFKVRESHVEFLYL
jgi:hypothetical protein